LIDQLRLGFNHPVFAQAYRETTFHRHCHRAAFGGLSHTLVVAAKTADPAAAGRQVDVPALRPGQAPVGTKALTLKVERVVAGVGEGAAGQQAVFVALELSGAADQSDPLGTTAVALHGQERRAFEFAGSGDRALGQIIGLGLPRRRAIGVVPGQGRSVFDRQA